MKKCLYDNCPNKEGTPGVEFHEVFEDTDDRGLPVSKLDCWICSVHLLELEEGQEAETGITQKAENQKKNQPQTPQKQPQKTQSVRGKILPETNNQLKTVVSLQVTATGKKAKSSGEPIACSGLACGLTLKENPRVPFFRFPPTTDPRYVTWKSFANPLGPEAWLCSRHFDQSQYLDQTLHILKDDAVPKYKTVAYNSKTKNNVPSDPVVRLTEEKLNNSDDLMLAECAAINCTSAYREDNSIKFFRIPMHSKTISDEWITRVGGLKKGSQYPLICQYHFAEKAFNGLTSLLPKSCPTFPYGPLNPRTKDFCPIGQEHLSVLIRPVPTPHCCVSRCGTQTLSKLALFYFPSQDKEAFDIWVQRAGINTACFPYEFISKSMAICPKHFCALCKVTEKDKNRFSLKFGALPTLFLPNFLKTPSLENSILQKRKIPLDPSDVPAITCVIDETRLSAKSQKLPPPERSEPQTKASTGLTTKVKYYSPEDFLNYVKKPKITVNGEEIKEALVKLYPESGGKEQGKVEAGASGAEESSNKSEPSSNSALNFESLVNSLGLPKQVGEGRARKRSRSRGEAQQRKKRGKVESSNKDPPDLAHDVGNEVDVRTTEEDSSTLKIHSYCSIDPLKPPDEPSLEVSLLKIFNATKAPEKNAFSVLADASNMPEPENLDGEHEYGSDSTLGVIRSAAQLCEFNEIKLKQLERLIRASSDTTSELENLLAKNLHAVLCYSSVEFMKKCFDQVIQWEIEKKKKGKDDEKKVELNSLQASAQMKKMAVALQAHSGKGYCALSQYLDLPAPSETRDWATHPNGYPGYSEKAFRLLRNDLKQLGGKKNVIFCLSVLEVPLKKCVQWDGDRIFGHVDLGFGRIENEFVEEATRALVFYATSLNDFRKLPLGYCLFDDLSVQVRANLITQFIVKLDNVGAKCAAVVTDSSVISYQVLIELGAISDVEHTPVMGSFVHPVNRHARVFCFVDSAQLLQSVNALWLEQRVLTNKDGRRIDYHVLEKMNSALKYRAEDLFKRSTPMSSAFVSMFNDLAAMMARISKDSPLYHKYCAVALSVLRNAMHLSAFADSNDTVKFLVNLSFVYDSFSSCHPFGEGDRKPIGANKTWWSEASRLVTVFNYFTGLSLRNGDRIVLSERKMLVTLICLNVASLRNLTRRVVSENNKFKVPVVYTESLTLNNVRQLIEALVGADRLCTPLEFKKAYSQYLDKLSLSPSDVLIPPSKPKPPRREEAGLGYKLTFAYSFKPISSVSDTVPQFLAQNAIESWLKSCDCIDCSQLLQNDMIKFCNGERLGNLIHDILAMLRQAERVLSEYDDIPCLDSDSFFLEVSYQTLNSLTSLGGFLNHGHLFNSVRFGEVTHFTVLVKGVLRAFLKARLSFPVRQERIKIEEPRDWLLKFRLGRSWT